MPCIRRKQILSYCTIAKSPTLVNRSILNQYFLKILLLTFKAIHKFAPNYISELVSLKDTLGVGTLLDQMTANV